jgi:hypothetical protein
MQKSHQRDVARALEATRIEPVALNKAAVFEQIAPVPL